MTKKTDRSVYFTGNSRAIPAIRIVGCGYQNCTATYRIKRDNCPFAVVEYVIRGKGFLKWNNRTVELGAGTVFGYGTNVPQEYWADRPDPFEKLRIAFAGRAPVSVLKGIMGGQVAGALTIHPHHKLHELFAGALNEADHSDPRSAGLVAHYLTAEDECGSPCPVDHREFDQTDCRLGRV